MRDAIIVLGFICTIVILGSFARASINDDNFLSDLVRYKTTIQKMCSSNVTQYNDYTVNNYTIIEGKSSVAPWLYNTSTDLYFNYSRLISEFYNKSDIDDAGFLTSYTETDPLWTPNATAALNQTATGVECTSTCISGGEIAASTISTANLQSGTLTWENISSRSLNIPWTGALGVNNLTKCAASQILKMDGTGTNWACDTDQTGTGSAANATWINGTGYMYPNASFSTNINLLSNGWLNTTYVNASSMNVSGNISASAVNQGGVQVINTITGNNITATKTGGTYTLTLPNPSITTKGGVMSLTCSGTDKLSAIGTDGLPVCSADQSAAGGGGANVSTTICSGNDKVSAINNATGAVTCTADQTGASAGNNETAFSPHVTLQRRFGYYVPITRVATVFTAVGMTLPTVGGTPLANATATNRMYHPI